MRSMRISESMSHSNVACVKHSLFSHTRGRGGVLFLRDGHGAQARAIAPKKLRGHGAASPPVLHTRAAAHALIANSFCFLRV